MDIFRLRYPEQVTIQNGKAYSLALGFFDGLHRGHQTVIQAAKQKAGELGIQSAVMTFDPHPSHLFGDGQKKVGYITQYEEKERLLAEMGIDALFIVTFDWSLASLSPEQFVEIFIKGLGVQHVTAGFDFTFGAKGVGTMERMSQLAEGAFGTTVIEKVTDQDEKVSSTRIRKLLSDGDVEETTQLLGRPFRTLGVVIDGDKRGRLLGFPTANVSVEASAILPANGVYAVRFSFDGHVYNGVCNVGTKPTFHDAEDAKVVVEVHVLDFDGDLYGKKAAVDWIAPIRKERKFSAVEQLIEQITKDKEKAKDILVSLS